MNTHQLECFEAVYREKSMNKAAKQLYMTPQGVSKAIQMLEGELDAELFERTKLGAYPTESADVLHEKASEIIRQMEDIRQKMTQLKNQKILRFRCGGVNILM